MSGHSKWATTKHKKAAIDSKRAKVFTRLGSLITIAARDGKSGDPNFNPSLRMALDNAKAASMPKENMDRAIKRGTGEGANGALIEDAVYEAYGPAGVAILIETLTDNKNRTIANIKTVLNKFGGSLAGSGSVAYQFKKVGELVIDEKKSPVKGEDLEMVIIDSGAEDFDSGEGLVVIRTAFTDLNSVKKKIEEASIPIDSAEVIEVAANPVEVPEAKMETVEKIIEGLEDLDDVTNVYTNLA